MVFCKQVLDQRRTYIEFNVTMNVQMQGKSSLFVGVVDRSRYRTEQLVSTFWKDSPSSFYWDVWNNKLIRIDENGVQSGVALGYGCVCQDASETNIGMMYDAKNRTLSYFKDGMDQGVAFHSVPRCMCPAIDLWFEAGHIEIVGRSKPSTKEYL